MKGQPQRNVSGKALPSCAASTRSGRDVRERNTKSQTPGSREIPNFKFHNLSQACCLGAWDLELLWSLEFGALIGGKISPLPDPFPTSPPACRATSFCLLAAS